MTRPARPPVPGPARHRAATCAYALLVAALVPACADETDERVAATGGDPSPAPALVREHGCISCHAVPGVPSVDRGIGPDLTGLPDRLVLAGQVPNRAEELVRWLLEPQEVVPGTLMPDTGLTEQEARDVAAYLYGGR